MRRLIAVGIRASLGFRYRSVPARPAVFLLVSGALGEDVQDEAGSVDDLQFCIGRDVSKLTGGQLSVEYQDLSIQLHRADEDGLQLTLTNHELVVGLSSALKESIEDLKARGVGQALELIE